jgi:DEAD/DEAH box helicase domain-containing protein
LQPETLARFEPTVFLYDNYPGGVGLSEPLWDRQAELLQRAESLVDACDCRAGCPSCVGPVLDEAVPISEGPRQLALRVLRALQAA